MNNKLKNIKYQILTATLLVYGYFGFYPFQFQLPIYYQANAVTHSTLGEIQFKGSGIGKTRAPPKWLHAAIVNSDFDIELEFQTTQINQDGPARILTISKDLKHRNITIGQKGTDLVIRINSKLSNQNGYPPYRFENVLKLHEWQKVHLSITSEKLNITVNKAPPVSNYLPENPISRWSPEYRLAIGNEFTNNRPWLGKIRQLVIKSGGKRFGYMREGRLYFPEYLVLKDVSYHLIPFSERDYGVKSIIDWTINLLGFVPFGFLIVLFSKDKIPVVKAMLICGLLSLSIEIGQLFIARRVTEVEDVILNTLGGLLGALIGKYYKETNK